MNHHLAWQCYQATVSIPGRIVLSLTLADGQMKGDSGFWIGERSATRDFHGVGVIMKKPVKIDANGGSTRASPLLDDCHERGPGSEVHRLMAAPTGRFSPRAARVVVRTLCLARRRTLQAPEDKLVDAQNEANWFNGTKY